MKLSLRGEVHRWDIGAGPREYAVFTVPFGVAKNFVEGDVFDARTGNGEQRVQHESWVKALRKEMAQGRYTPDSFAVALRPSHRKALKFHDEKRDVTGEGKPVSRVVSLELDEDDADYLPLVNGMQRFGALKQLYKAADTEEQRARIDAQPITFFAYLDGSSKGDFLNLQKGKPVDPAHMLSMRVRQRDVPSKDQPYYTLAMEVARQLQLDKESPFFGQVRFDSRGAGSGFPINSLCAKSASDIATSLIGLARVGIDGPNGPYDADGLVLSVKTAYKALQDHAPELLKGGHVLTAPLTNEATKGSCTMLVGVAMALHYRLALDVDKDDDAVRAFVKACVDTLGEKVNGSFSGPDKRAWMNEFVTEFFRGVPVEKWEGIPKDLVKILSPSTFCVSKLPKEKKPRETKEADATKKGPDTAQRAADAVKKGAVAEVVADVVNGVVGQAGQPVKAGDVGATAPTPDPDPNVRGEVSMPDQKPAVAQATLPALQAAPIPDAAKPAPQQKDTKMHNLADRRVASSERSAPAPAAQEDFDPTLPDEAIPAWERDDLGLLPNEIMA